MYDPTHDDTDSQILHTLDSIIPVHFAQMVISIFKKPCWIVVVALQLLFSGCAVTPRATLESESYAQVDFSGSWQLDYRLSEDLYEKIETLQRIAISNAQRSAPPVPGGGRHGPVITVNNRPINSFASVISLGQMAGRDKTLL